jgi:hypothetical protein
MIDEIFKKITEIIDPKYICKHKNGKLTLQDSTSKPVEIKKQGKLICLEIDKHGNKFIQFFNNQVPELCSIADRIIFYSKDNCLYVFVVELKTNCHSGAMKQVNASYELAKYISSTVSRMLNYKFVEVKYRGLIFSGKTLRGTTKAKNLNYEVHPVTQLHFKHLPTGKEIHLDTLTF